jgi:hypothetical protein
MPFFRFLYYIYGMIVTRKNLRDKSQTTGEMKRLINRYHSDLNRSHIIKGKKRIPLSSLPLKSFFNLVKKLPYKKDSRKIEVVQRPLITLKTSKRLGADCKKKSILISAYLKNNGIPYRLIGSSKHKSGRIHHVFPQARLGKRWINIDATYDDYKIGQPKKVTKAVVL